MVKKMFEAKAAYAAPSLKEVKTSIECGFALSNNFGADDYTEGETDWLK